jgi:hypothetical protein
MRIGLYHVTIRILQNSASYAMRRTLLGHESTIEYAVIVKRINGPRNGYGTRVSSSLPSSTPHGNPVLSNNDSEKLTFLCNLFKSRIAIAEE